MAKLKSLQTTIDTFVRSIEEELERFEFGNNPKELYEPIRYILNIGGKRLRPVLTLLAYNLFKNDTNLITLPAAAVEAFHNFTLLHDDIMDEAPIRRGKVTVHEKWNKNTAILSGDVMLVRVYDMFLDVDSRLLPTVIKKFNKCAAGVCEGQQLDMIFENRLDVTEAEYLDMIRLKTAVLLGFSLELGGMLAEADDQICQILYDVGVNAGIGFQLKDDLLDVYADSSKFGKRIGGDILADKKTFLLIKALEISKGSEKNELLEWIGNNSGDDSKKIDGVKNIYNSLDIKRITEAKMNHYFDSALGKLNKLKVDDQLKIPLKEFIQNLINREK